MELTIDMLKQFQDYLLNEEKSKATIEKYMRDVNAFYTFLKDDKIINKETVLEYKSSLLEHYKTTSINSMLVALNTFFYFLKTPQFCVKTLKIQKQVFGDESKELTKAEYRRLLDSAKKQDRLYLLIQMICSTGIRVSEHKYITVESLSKGRATVRNKGKTRDIILPKNLIKLLKSYCKKNGIKSGAIFITRSGKPLDRSNIWKMMKQLCEEAKVERSKVFPHNLRHLFAFTYYSIEKDLVRLADVLGHSSIETTRNYTKTSHFSYDKIFIKMNLLDI